MTTSNELDIAKLIEARNKFVADFDRAVMSAQQHMALADIDHENEEANMDAYEERFHCEVCIIREVLDIVWPAMNTYLDFLENAVGMPQDPVN